MDLKKNKLNNPVVHRYTTWKNDKWVILNAAQAERQRLMLEIAERQKTVKELTAIIDEHQPKPLECDYVQEPMEQSWEILLFATLS